MKIKAISIIKILSLIELLFLVRLEYEYLGNALGIQRKNTMTLQILVSLLATILIVFTIGKLKTVRKSILSAFVLFLILIVTTVIAPNFSFGNTGDWATFIKSIYWFLIFLFGYTISLNFKDTKLPIAIMIISLIAYMIRFLQTLQFDYSVSTRDYTVTAVYYVICTASFVFCIQNKILKKILGGVVVLLTCLSFKRSALIVMLVTGIVLAWDNRKKIKVDYLVKIGIGIILAVIGALLVRFVNEGFGDFTLDAVVRVWNRRFDSSNDRLMIQKDVLERVYNSNIMQLIFGHGQNAVIKASPYGLSAHNDFLEILYNYGVLGFVAFIVFIFYLFREKKAIKEYCNKEIYNGYVYSLMIFLIASLPSHMLTYGTYFLFLALYMGFAIGQVKKNPV